MSDDEDGHTGAPTSAAPQAPIKFDRSSFTKELRLVALRVPAQKCSVVIKELSGHLVKMPKIRTVTKPDGEEKTSDRLVLLSQHAPDDGTPALEDLSEPVQEVAKRVGAQVTTHTVTLDYGHYTAEEVLKRILPGEVDPPSSFETVGHVAHLNLREQYLPYKSIIAEILLEKNKPRIRTIVNKVSTIATEFRTFPLEVLAGDKDLNVELKESGAIFRFNYGEVYWNSRLQTEHDRLITLIHNSHTVWDVMAGVGPFAIPLALKGCRVYANDLNPRSYHYLKQNTEANRVSKRLEAHNVDGREFVRQLAQRKLPVHEVIMNLPASALEFLDVLGEPGLLDYLSDPPTIHVYCFSKAQDPISDALQRAAKHLGRALPSDVKVHQVRDVAPRKAMLCLSFKLPPASTEEATGVEKSGEKRSVDEVADACDRENAQSEKKLRADQDGRT